MRFVIHTVDGNTYYSDEIPDSEDVTSEEMGKLAEAIWQVNRTYVAFDISGVEAYFNPKNIVFITTE